MYRRDIDGFGEANYPLPPSCLVSVYGSPNAVPTLHYSVPLVGVADPITLYIHRSLRAISSSGIMQKLLLCVDIRYYNRCR